MVVKHSAPVFLISQTFVVLIIIQVSVGHLSILEFKRGVEDVFQSLEKGETKEKMTIADKPEKDHSRSKESETIDIFLWLDLNKDGYLTPAEMALVAIFADRAQPRRIWQRLRPHERNGDGKVDMEEFLHAFREDERQDQLSLRQLIELFDVFDTDRDGFIRVDEIRATMPAVVDAKLSEERINKIINDADLNRDGAIDLYELYKNTKFIL